MPEVNLDYFGKLGTVVAGEGWDVVPSWRTKATASANVYTAEIRMLPPAYRAANRPGRIRDYVLRHELAHAAHASLLRYDTHPLREARGLSNLAAIEVVADAWCLLTHKHPLMRRWVAQSCIYHTRIGSRYTMRDVESPEARQIVDRLSMAIVQWGTDA